MHSFSRSLLGLGALTLAGCGAPAELDESLFPGLEQTGYTDGFSPTGGSGAGATPSSGGTGSSGMGNLPVGGSGNVGQGGSAPVATGGNGSVSAGGSAPIGQGGQQQGGSAAMGGGPSGGGSCPDDITVLFRRPPAQGGCEQVGCHVAGGIPPDLVSPNVEERLVGVASTCAELPFYIGTGVEDSFLANKLVGDPPACDTFPMPLGGSMTDEEEQCVLDWIAEVSGG